MTAGSAVQVNDDLDAVVARPSDGLLEVWKLSRDVRFPRPHLESPVPDGYADVVQPAAREGRDADTDQAQNGHMHITAT